MDSPSSGNTRRREGGISEKDYAFEEIQSRSRELHLGDSLSHKPSSVPLPRRRPRRRGTALSEGWKDITDDSGSATEDDDEVKRPHIAPPATTSEYHEFIDASRALEKTLDELTHTVQRLGSALVLSRACRDVRNELCKVRKFFENTATRFLGVLADDIKRKKLKHTKRKNRPRERRSSTSFDDHQNEISEALDNLYQALEMFLTAIRDFEDYSDSDGEQSLEKFMEQVGILSGCLSYFGEDGDLHEFPRFIYEKTVAMKKYIREMDIALARFMDIGVPCISFAQKRSAKMLLNAATVATFFAGVAATVLQFSIELNETPTRVAANTLWFASLVLSIGSAINALLAMTWRQAVFSSPKRQQPWFIRFWTRQGYLVLLVVSVLTFLGGLLCYMHETQKRVAFWTATGCTAFCSIGLANVSVWFGIERWDFAKFRKTMHPLVTPDDSSDQPSASRDIMDYLKVQWFKVRVVMMRIRDPGSLPTTNGSKQDLVFREPSPEPIYTIRDRFKNLVFLIRNIPAEIRSYRERRRQPSESQTTEDIAPSVKTAHSTRPGQSPRSQSDLLARTASLGAGAAYSKELEEFVEKSVKGLCEKQSGLRQNGARVKHMQFSPCGKWLAVCYQFSCIVYKVGTRLEYYQQLRHTRRSAKQVEWSSDSKRLITRLKDCVRLWGFTENQEFKVIDTLYLMRKLKWVRWVTGDAFLALTEDNYIERVSLKTFKVTMRELPRDLTYHEFYTTSQEDIILFIATHYFDESKETYIDCIIVYNMDIKAFAGEFYNQSTQQYGSVETLQFMYENSTNGRIERKIPLLHDVESLAMCDDGEHLIVSYEENAPEVWKYLPPREDTDEVEGHEVVRVTELVVPDEYSELCVDAEWGDALFMGPSNEIVACPADDRIYFWNRHSKECIYAVSVGDGDEDDVPEFAWYIKGNSILMASASGKNGSMKFWDVGVVDTTGNTLLVSGRPSRPQTPRLQVQGSISEVLTNSPTQTNAPV